MVLVAVKVAKKPELVKAGTTSYQCSACEFTIELIRPAALTPAQWEQRVARHLSAHIKHRHAKDAD